MKIAILQGSPRRNGNSAFFAKAFKEGAESAGHSVELLELGSLKINGCLGCEYCHTKGEGACVQKDDMEKVWETLDGAEMILLCSPVYYWSFSGQMQSCITRFYAKGKPAAKKYGLILSSGSDGVYDAPVSQIKSCMEYFGTELVNVFTFNGDDQKTEANYETIKAFGASVK